MLSTEDWNALKDYVGALENPFGVPVEFRLPFGELFFDGTFGKALGEGEALDFVPSLKMVQLAPSAANKHPWRAVVDGSKVHFYEASTMKESPLGDVQKVDIGIALAHFEMRGD